MKARDYWKIVTWVTTFTILILLLLSCINTAAPHFYHIKVAEVTSEVRTHEVKSPSHSWFGSLSLVMENGTIPVESQLQIVVKKNGTLVYSNTISGLEMAKSNQGPDRNYRISLKDSLGGGSAGDALGYGAAFSVIIKADGMGQRRASLWAHFVDDRKLRFPNAEISIIKPE